MVEMEFSLFLLLLAATAWASPSWPERTSSSQCSWDLQEAVLESGRKSKYSLFSSFDILVFTLLNVETGTT